MADLKTNYVDDVLDTSVNDKRKYNMIQNADGTVSFDDVTTYTQNGDSFGAKDVNDTNTAVNVLNENLTHKTNAISGTYDEGSFVTVDSIGYDKENKKLCLKVEGADTVIPFSGEPSSISLGTPQTESGTVTSSGMVLTASLTVSGTGLYYLYAVCGGSSNDGRVTKNSTTTTDQITPVDGFVISRYRTMITKLNDGDIIRAYTINSGGGSGSRSATISIYPLVFG